MAGAAIGACRTANLQKRYKSPILFIIVKNIMSNHIHILKRIYVNISLGHTETSLNVFLECQHILSEVYPCYQCPLDAMDCYSQKMFLHLSICKIGIAAAFLLWQVHLGRILRDQGSRYPRSIRDHKINMVITHANKICRA